MSFRKLQREWYAKAAASGFVDLEAGLEDGRLSNRGKLHVVTDTPEEDARLARRIEDGTAYTAWAESVLYNARFPSREARECWRLHVDGLSEIEIATALAIKRWRVNKHLAGTRERVGKDGKAKRWRNRKRQRAARIRSLVTRSDPRVLVKLVAVMMRQQGHASR